MMNNINKYVQQLNSLSSNTAKLIIETAAILVEAKQELNKDDYSAFLTQTKYDKNSSAIRKLEVIGHAQSRLKAISELLPCSWTTIYQVASLNIRDFDVLVAGKHLHPLITSAEIDAVIKPALNKSLAMRISIDLDINIDKKTVKNIIEWIDNNIPSYLFKLNTSLGINNLLGEK
jgi:hypothetical protein